MREATNLKAGYGLWRKPWPGPTCFCFSPWFRSVKARFSLACGIAYFPKRLRLSSLIGLVISLTLAGSAAESPSQNSFLLRHWSSEDGLTWGDIKSLARTPDGFLWIGTDLGLVRFDGVQFQALSAVQFPLPANDRVSCLLADRQGGLWVGTEEGRLLRGLGGKFTEVASATATGGKKLTALAEDGHGAVWVATLGAGLRRYQAGGWQVFSQTNGLPGNLVTAVLPDANGLVWALVGGKLVVWNGEQMTTTATSIPSSEPVMAIASDHDGRLWAATTITSRGLGGRVFSFKDGRWSEPTSPYPWPQDSMRSTIGSLLDDDAGGFWVTTSGGGVFHWSAAGTWNSLIREGPMADTTVNAFLRDQEGTLWFGLQGGQLFRAHPRAVNTLYPEPAPLRHIIQTACASRDGSVWLGTYGGGIFRYHDGEWTSYGRAQGLATLHAFTLFEDRHTNLWAGLRGGLFQFDSGQFKKVASYTAGAVLALFEDKDGNLWIGSNAGLARFRDDIVQVFRSNEGVAYRDNLVSHDVCAIGQDSGGRIWIAIRNVGLFRQAGEKFERYVTHSPIDNADIRTLFFDSRGSLWIATFGQGLFRLQDDQVHQWRSQNGLPSDYLLALIEDATGGFWLGTANGIFGCSRDLLDKSVADGSPSLLGRYLAVAEGLDTTVCSGWGQPVATRSTDGRLWFPNQNGVAVFDPAALGRTETKWPVIIEEVSSDGAIQIPESDGVIRIKSGLRRLEFHYTLPNLMAPNIRFRYQLKGLEDGWTDAGQRRIADYNHLPPGRYVFSVMAGGLDGIWQESQHPLDIEVVPRLWERNSVRATVAAGLLGSLLFAAWVTGRARLRRRLLMLVKAQQAAEDERQRIARDLHDNLGAGLTEVALMSDLALTDAGQPVATKKNLTEIFAAVRSLARSLDETVWAISRKNETVEQSLVFICKAAQDFLRLAGISCRLNAPDVLPASYFSSTVRHNLFLATREALNNIVKHAHATEVWLRLKLEADRLTLIIEDNGKGFVRPPAPTTAAPEAPPPTRSGLANLERRLQEIGGTAECRSEPGQGTVIKLSVPLKPERPPPL